MTHDPYDGRTRDQYLDDLADEYGMPRAVVHNLAELLGSSEDFDGLVAALDDYHAD